MHFLYPAFLFALISLAIPVVVHLFNFRRYQKVQFSNVQFLKELQEQQASRRNLKEWLILLSRLLALTFLVLAFAKPYIPQNNQDAGRQNVVSIFVDNSYSMQTLNREGSLLDQARQKAKEVASAYHINDRFQLLTQDFEGKHQRLLNRDEFYDAVDEVKISARSRGLQQIVNRQQSLLDGQPGAAKAIYIISDLQKNIADKPLKTSVPVNIIQLKATNLPNVAVDSIWLLSAVHKPGDNEKLVIRLHNYAGEEAAKVPLKLFINGHQKALGSFTVGAHAVLTDTLNFSGLQAGWQQGEIQLEDNPVIFDNKFYFTFYVKKQLPVLLIDGGIENSYLKAVFASDTFFKATRMPEGNVDYAGLNAYPLIVLSDVKAISAGLVQQLQVYVNKGGTLLVFPAGDAEVESYKALLLPLNAAYPSKLITETTKVSALNLQNPLFKRIFDAVPQNPDLPVVKKYYELIASGGESIMQLPGNQPFWGGYKSRAGRVYVAAVALGDDFSNLQRHGLFVPVMFRIALLSGRDMPLFYTLGSNESIETIPLRSTEKQLITLNKNGHSIIPDVRQQEGSTLLYLPGQLQETGIYELKKQDSTAAILAFNDNRKESDLSYLAAAEIDKLLPGKGKNIINEKRPLTSVVNDVNNGVQLWKLCIILALIFLAAEIVLIRYYKTDKRTLATGPSTQTTH
ncbi:MAG: BatA domain-containing protein [Mucilaginibacter sp.]